MNITGIILAGGKSSRMGTDKGLIEVNGITMIEHVINALKPFNIPLLIVSNNPEYQKFDLPVVEDIIKDKGPIAGIATGLYHSKTKYNIIVSCDTPFITTELISYLLKKREGFDITMAKKNEKTHPLIGIYTRDCYKTFNNELASNHLKLMDACMKLKTKIVDVSKTSPFNCENLFRNINTKEELENIAI